MLYLLSYALRILAVVSMILVAVTFVSCPFLLDAIPAFINAVVVYAVGEASAVILELEERSRSKP